VSASNPWAPPCQLWAGHTFNANGKIRLLERFKAFWNLLNVSRGQNEDDPRPCNIFLLLNSYLKVRDHSKFAMHVDQQTDKLRNYKRAGNLHSLHREVILGQRHLDDCRRILFYHFFISCNAYFYKYFDRKEWNVDPPSSNFCRYACHVTTGVTQYFYLAFIYRQPLIILHSKLYSVCPLKSLSRSLKTFKTSTNQYLVSNEYFYMVNPCCDVTKTTVNEIKNVSKMADISSLQVKIFQEP
jgi:hypothetical protein